ncbi:MAG: hypothetical protein WCF84_03005, partial [Anaerolineae bacterium]
LWNRCYRWIEATTSWREAHARDLTHQFLAGFRSGNLRSCQPAINAYLVALEEKKGDQRRLIDDVEHGYNELVRPHAPESAGDDVDLVQDEKSSILALLKLVEKELEEQTQDWRTELQALAVPQREPAASEQTSLLDSLKALLDSLKAFLPLQSRPQNRRAQSFAFRVPRLSLRRSRKSGSSDKK